jgi:hypothetical protein
LKAIFSTKINFFIYLIFSFRVLTKKVDEKPKKRSKNIFKYADNDQDEENHLRSSSKTVADEDEDAGSDTFDMFSSQESLNEHKDTITSPVKSEKANTVPQTPKKVELMIDLGQLSDQEGADDLDVEDNTKNAKVQQDYEKFSPTADTNESMFRQAMSTRSTSRQQIKPDHIPNLALDMDDDRSQSVAVSLAKSMCKEIDYQKEMEMLVQQQPPVIATSASKKTKPVSEKPVKQYATTNSVTKNQPSAQKVEFNDITTVSARQSNSNRVASHASGPSTSYGLNMSNLNSVPPLKIVETNNKFKIINSTLNQVFQPKKYYK